MNLNDEIKIFAVNAARQIRLARAMKIDAESIEEMYSEIVDWIHSHGEQGTEIAFMLLKNSMSAVGWRSKIPQHLQRAEEDYRLFTTGNSQQLASPPAKPQAPAKKQAGKKKASATPKKKSGSTKPS